MTQGMPRPGLNNWPRPLRLFLAGFLFLMTSAVSTGLIFLYTTTGFSMSGTIEHYRGSPVEGDEIFSEREKYEKPASELLLTTHNHLFGFSFIFLFLGIIFYFNTTITGRFKTFLLVEPFVSTWLTFGGIWGIRYLHAGFVAVSLVGAILTYLSYYFVTAVIIIEMFKLKDRS